MRFSLLYLFSKRYAAQIQRSRIGFPYHRQITSGLESQHPNSDRANIFLYVR